MRAKGVRRLRALTRRVCREKSGFTMIEMVVAMAILGVVLAAISSLFTSSIHAQSDLDARFQAQVNLNTAVGKLRREAHGACAVRAGWTTSSITLNMPATGTFQPPATPCTTPTAVTWCTVGAGFRYVLWRIPNSTTCTTTATGAKQYADYITVAAVFPSYTAENLANSTLGKLQIHFPINVKSNATTTSVYTLDDDLVLRNSAV
jgi:prepilin-type N-terminal cleavage/methylation domain-containing protein